MTHHHDTSHRQHTIWNHLGWWAMLVVAVLAIPPVAFLITLNAPASGYQQLALFILTCWLCTYLGMKIMKYPVG